MMTISMFLLSVLLLACGFSVSSEASATFAVECPVNASIFPPMSCPDGYSCEPRPDPNKFRCHEDTGCTASEAAYYYAHSFRQKICLKLSVCLKNVLLLTSSVNRICETHFRWSGLCRMLSRVHQPDPVQRLRGSRMLACQFCRFRLLSRWRLLRTGRPKTSSERIQPSQKLLDDWGLGHGWHHDSAPSHAGGRLPGATLHRFERAARKPMF